MKQFYLICNLGLYNAIRRIQEKGHEWCVASLACNRPILDWRVRAAGGLCRPHCLYDVTTIRRLSVLSVLSVVHACRLPSAIPYEWLNTDAISIDIIIRRRETVRCHRRSVCLWAISLPHALQASRQSLMGHHGVKIFDNRKKIDFKQTIIDFQEKTILTSLIVTLQSELTVTRGHWNWSHWKAWVRFRIRLP